MDVEPAHTTQRSLVLQVPDWPALALGLAHDIAPSVPVIALHGSRVASVTAQARAAGVEAGMTKRAARARCPEARALPRDTEAEHRVFAAAITVLEGVVARFTLLAPGQVEIPLSALMRSHDTEAQAVEELLVALTDATGWEVFAGIADSTFAAVLAAGRQARVAPGRTRSFLAPLSVTTLTDADPVTFQDLVPMLQRLGLYRLGDVARLSQADMHARFGLAGMRAHRLACGGLDRLPVDHVRAREFQVHRDLEPPTARPDALSFAARTVAGRFLAGVRAAGLVCTQVEIVLHAVTGESHARTWRLETMDETTIADRLRWQAEGWAPQTGEAAQAPASASPAGAVGSAPGPVHAPDSTDLPDSPAGPDFETEDGISGIELIAAELMAPLHTQRSLFDTGTGQVASTLERLQGLFGPDAVLVPGLQGGREPSETNMWTPWQQQAVPTRDPAAPWPGELPAPRPTIVECVPIELLDARGQSVVARPQGLDSAPATIRYPDGATVDVVDHSSAWPVESGWWEPQEAQYLVRLHVVTADGRALLLRKDHGHWQIAGRWM